MTAKGNGAYLVSGYPQDPGNTRRTDGQGASIFVAYGNPADGKINLVTLKAGLGVINETGESMSNSFTGLSVGAGFSSAVMHNAVGDGQNFNDRLLFKGTVVEGNNAFPGAEGNYWDNRIDDVTALMSAGDSTLTSQIDINPGNRLPGLGGERPAGQRLPAVTNTRVENARMPGGPGTPGVHLF